MSRGEAAFERYQAVRAQRKHDVRPLVLRAPRQERVHLRLVDKHDADRPKTRADCIDGPRPCPWVSCRHHLYLEVTKVGSLRVYRPDLEPHQLNHSCALDIADAGGTSMEEIGSILNVTRERIRQVEDEAIRALVNSGGADIIAEAAPEGE